MVPSRGEEIFYHIEQGRLDRYSLITSNTKGKVDLKRKSQELNAG